MNENSAWRGVWAAAGASTAAIVLAASPVSAAASLPPKGDAVSSMAVATTAPDPPVPLTVPRTPIVPASGGGYLPGSSDVDNLGTYTYGMPLDVPDGRAGMQPNLSLVYSSGRGDGMLGTGWSLSGLSAITRCGRSLNSDNAVAGVRFDGSDRFCLDGIELMTTASTYKAIGNTYYTRAEAFVRVRSAGGSAAAGPDSFTVQTHGGRLRTYSAFTARRSSSGVAWNASQWVQGDTMVTTPKVTWLLTTEKDTSGNEIEYDYTTDDAHLPTQITYTHAPGFPGQRRVQFTYENRLAPSLSLPLSACGLSVAMRWAERWR